MQIKKILSFASIAALLVPALALAAANDVTLTTDVTLNIGGITVNVTGSSATIASIVVNSSSFAVTVQSGSYFKVVAPNGNALDGSLSADVTYDRKCSSSLSSYEITANTTATVTITPASDTCASRVAADAAATPAASSGGGNGPVISSGGGGGGGGSYTPPSTPVTKPATTGSAASQLQQKLQGLLGQIATISGSAMFKHDLQLGSANADVKALQVYLNAHGYVITSGGAGSPGHETTKFGGLTKAALIKLQKAAGITPASGYFGAKTRAYIAAHP